MEKLKPHYDLGQVQARVFEMEAEAFTKTALEGGRAMGLTIQEMVSVVTSLDPEDFYKSMTTYSNHQVWQDVYHGNTPNGRVAYIKLTMRDDGSPVIQFKER